MFDYILNGYGRAIKSVNVPVDDFQALIDGSGIAGLLGNKAPDSIDVSKSIWNQDASKLIDTIHKIPNTNGGIDRYYKNTSPKLDSISSSRLHNWAVKNYGRK